MRPILGTDNRVIFSAAEKEAKKTIIFTEADNKPTKPTRGTVLHVTGEDKEGKKPLVKVGDKVVISSAALIDFFEEEGETFYHCKESFITVIL